MSAHLDAIRLLLATGPQTASQLIKNMGISQPTLSRSISRLGDEVVRVGAARYLFNIPCETQRAVSPILLFIG